MSSGGPRLAVVATLLTLLEGEVGLRVAGYGDAREGWMTLGADLQPGNFPGHFRQRDPQHGVLYGLNADGFRGREWDDARSPGRARIVLLGDSLAFGVGVTDDQTLAAHLEAAMAARGRPADVVNLGVPGSNTFQQAELARRLLPRLRPDAVVAVVTGNDAETMPWNPDPVLACGVPVTPGERAVHALRSRVYLSRPVYAAVAREGCPGPTWCWEPLWGEGVAARCFRASLGRVAAAAAVQGATFAVAFYPVATPAWAPGAPHPMDELQAQAAAQEARALGAPFVDFTPTLRPYGGAALKVPADDWHPNGTAHRMAAQALASALPAR